MAFNIDVNMFVDAYSKGLHDAQLAPSDYSAFFKGLNEGYDQTVKNQQMIAATEQTQLENQIKQNQIDMQPYTNEVTRMQGTAASLKNEAMTRNPEAYIQNDISTEQVKNQENEMKMDLQRREQELQQLIQQNDPKLLGKAVTSGRYADVIAASNGQYKAAIEPSFGYWDVADQKAYLAKDFAEKEVTLSKAYEDKLTRRYDEAMDAFEVDGYLPKALGITKASLPDFIRKAEIREIEEPPMRPKIKEGGGYETDKYGNVIKEVDTEALDKTGKKIKVLFYDGQPVLRDIPGDTERTFERLKLVQAFKTRQMPGQEGGTGNLVRHADEVKAEQEKAEKAAREEAERIKKQGQSDEEAFYAGQDLVRTEAVPAPMATATPTPSVSTSQPAPVTPPGVKAAKVSATPTPQATVPQSPTPVPVTPPGVIPQAGATPQPIITPKSVVTAVPDLPAKTATPTQAGPEPTVPAVAQRDVANPKREKTKPIFDRMLAESQAKRGQQPQPPATKQPVAYSSDVAADRPKYVEVMNTTGRPAAPAVYEAINSHPVLGAAPALLKAAIVQESGGRAGAISPTGVRGVAQVTQATGNSLMPDFDPTDPIDSALGGAMYLQDLSRRFDNPMLALTAYNAGPGIVATAVKMAGSTDWSQVKKYLRAAVLANADALRRSGVKDVEAKAAEASEYAERVVHHMGAFVRTNEDMRMMRKLEEQGVLRMHTEYAAA